MYSIARYVATTQIKQIASYCLSIDDLVGPPNSRTVRWNRRDHQEWTIQRHWQQLSHRKQDEEKEINKNAEHKTHNNAENQKDGQHWPRVNIGAHVR